MRNILRPLSCGQYSSAGYAALCGFVCLCLCAFAPQAQAAPQAKTQTGRSPAEKKKTGWDFHESDKNTLNARWRESIATTLRETTFAPSAPAGRWLQRSKDTAGALPPAQIESLDKILPPESKGIMFGDMKTPITGEFTNKSIGWRPDTPQSAAVVEPGVTAAEPALREERSAGAYADFHPDEDVELKLGPEYRFSSQTLRPEQTGRGKNIPGSFGMGMQLKIDF